MTITVAEITLSNKAKGKEEIEMLKKKRMRNDWINRYMTNHIFLSSQKQSKQWCTAAATMQVLCEQF